jgi:galactokinase
MFSAPGRVNLIGEHTDYNEGFVLPVAIDRNTVVAAAPREDNFVRVFSHTMNERAEFRLDDFVSLGKEYWLNYIKGMAQALRERGHNLRGADLLIASDVPLGAGLSSSAALEVSTGLALLSLTGEKVDRVALARAAQFVENNYICIKSGIMDQLTSALGRRGFGLLIDCRSLETQYIPLNIEKMVFVVCDSRVKHSLASTEYNTRHEECERGVELLREKLHGIQSLRDVSVEDIKRYESILPETIKRRCRHVVTENKRALNSAECLWKGDLDGFGRAMFQSHKGLSHKKLNFLRIANNKSKSSAKSSI